MHKLNLQLHEELMGDDLCVCIHGGDRGHIGSVAIAEPRKSLADNNTGSATVSVYNVLGHKDGEVAQRMAFSLAAKTGKRCVVVCGIHYDQITNDTFLALDDWIMKTTELLIEKYR